MLAVALGVGLTRARQTHLPPLLAWEGPDATSGTRETELRLFDAARKTPADARAALDLGQFYLDDAKPFEALWALRDAQRLDPQALKPRLLAARALEMGQLYQPAAELLQAAVRDYPGDAEAARQLADLQLSLSRPAEAVATLQSLSQIQNPKSKIQNRHDSSLPFDARLLLGRALEAAGLDQEALDTYRRCQQLEPKSEQVYLRIGKLLMRLGKTADARQAFMASQILNPRSGEALYYQGLLELERGPAHEDAARQKFAEAVGVNEQFAPAHAQLGLHYQRRREWDRATNVLTRAFQLDPDNAEALLQLSRVRRAAGDRAGASYYQGLYYDAKDARPKAAAQYAAMAAGGDTPRGPLLVSEAYLKMDRKQEAADAARDGLRRYPNDVELTERLIAIDLLTGSLKEAEQLCRDWMRRDPSAVRPVWLLGRVLLADRHPKEALVLLERAARAEPANAEYQYAIGAAYAEQPSRRHWELAARYFGRAVTLQPDEARFRHHLGLALQNLGRLEGARRQFLRSMDLDVNQSAPLNNLVQVARALKQPDQVTFWAPLVRDVEQRLREELPAWKRVWDHPHDAAGYLPLARFLIRAGELRKARNILEQAVALQPDLTAAQRDLERLRRTLDVL